MSAPFAVYIIPYSIIYDTIQKINNFFISIDGIFGESRETAKNREKREKRANFGQKTALGKPAHCADCPFALQ